MSFPMSKSWTSYVVPKPPKGGSKTQNGRFPCKIALEESQLQSTFFVWKPSTTKL